MRKLFFLSVLLLLAVQLVGAQAQPTFRIGVLDTETGPLTTAARLAVQDINASGGVRGADGTFFRLELAVQPTNNGANLQEAVDALNQVGIIAALGPITDSEALNGLPLLQQLNVPVFTTATDDTITVSDTSGRIFRARAAQILQGQALADYFVRELGINRIATVQLDTASTNRSVGFSTAAIAQGVAPELFLLQAEMPDLTARILQYDPQAVAIFGSAALSGELNNQLRDSGYTGQIASDALSDPTFQSIVPLERQVSLFSTTTWPFTATDAASDIFLDGFVRSTGRVPGAIEAAAFDAVTLLAEAIQLPGDLVTNLLALDEVRGVQGFLRPSQLAPGETSNNVAVVRMGALGAPQVAARYAGGVRLPEDEPLPGSTPTPAPTATPEGVVAQVTDRPFQNVRTGPSTQYDIIGQLQENEIVQVIGANLNNSWIVIDFRGRQGWMSAGILDITGDLNTVPIVDPPPTPTPGATATPTPPQEADIIIMSAVASPSPIIPNQPFNVTVTLQNAGNTDAGQFAVAATFPPNEVFTSAIVPGLARGQTTTAVLSGTLNNTGTYTVVIVADLNDDVPEGPAGEANNFFNFTYTVDRPVINRSSSTLNPGNTIDLEGNAAQGDANWTGNDLNALGSAQLGLIPNVTFDTAHWDLINPSIVNRTSIPAAELSIGSIIGIRTADGNRAVMRVDSITIGGQLILTWRVYQN